MQFIHPPVTTALILVCDKCGKRLGRKNEDNASRLLSRKLKEDSKREFGKKAVRVVLTSCLNVCAKDRVTVAIVSTAADGAAARFMEVDPRDLEKAVASVLKTIRPSIRP